MKKSKKVRNDTNFNMILREFKHDKGATFFLFFLVGLILLVYGYALALNQKQVMHIDLLNGYSAPLKDGHLLGTDQGGRDIFQYLILGVRNSLNIGIAVTCIVEVIGIVLTM